MAWVVHEYRSAERAVGGMVATGATVATLRCTVVNDGAGLRDTSGAQDCRRDNDCLGSSDNRNDESSRVHGWQVG